MKKDLKKANQRLISARKLILGMATAGMALFMRTPVWAADSIGSSKIATGTQNLVNDLTTWLLLIAPAVTIVAIAYYFIRKAISDEMEHKKCCARKCA